MGGIGQFAVIQSVAPSFGVEVIPVDVREVKQDLAAFVRAGGGLIVTASGKAVTQRELIVSLAGSTTTPVLSPPVD